MLERSSPTIDNGRGNGTLGDAAQAANATPTTTRFAMSKGMDQKKETKKKSEKSLKEKRAEKKEKKAAKGR